MIENEISELIDKVKEERELQKIFSSEMSAYLKISDKTYSRIEKKESDLSMKHFFMICKKLKRKPDYFFGGGNSIYFSDCHYSGNHNIYNMSDLPDESKNTLLALAQLIVNNTRI